MPLYPLHSWVHRANWTRIAYQRRVARLMASVPLGKLRSAEGPRHKSRSMCQLDLARPATLIRSARLDAAPEFMASVWSGRTNSVCRNLPPLSRVSSDHRASTPKSLRDTVPSTYDLRKATLLQQTITTTLRYIKSRLVCSPCYLSERRWILRPERQIKSV